MKKISFLVTFGTLIDKYLNNVKVTSSKVSRIAVESEQFNPIWVKLNSEFGSMLAVKKVVDKIRTFARNNRPKLGQK